MKIGVLCILTFYSALVAAQSTSTPIILKDNLIYIPVRINNSRVLNFLFDTGAEVTVVDQKIAKEIQLKATGKSRIGTAGKTIDATTSLLNKLMVGNFTIDSQSIEILSIQHLSDHLNLQIDGIIGYELLKEFVITTDLDQLKFILQDTAGFLQPDHSLVVEKIDVEHHHFGLPLAVKFRKNAKSEMLVFKFDTAFPGYLSIHNPTVEKYELLSSPRLKERKGFGADTTLTTNLRSKIKEVSFDLHSWKNVPIIYEVDPISMDASKKNTEAGLVGQEILNDFNITYNYPKGQVYMVPRK